MKPLALAILLLLAAAAPHEPADLAPRFVTVPIYLDSRDVPLAAYQVDLRNTSGTARIVGIEGGEHEAFADPPHYDPRAMQRDHVILAAYSTLPPERLPTGRTRVATVHVMAEADGPLQWSLEVIAAGDAEGRRIDAAISIEEETRR